MGAARETSLGERPSTPSMGNAVPVILTLRAVRLLPRADATHGEGPGQVGSRMDPEEGMDTRRRREHDTTAHGLPGGQSAAVGARDLG